MADQQARTVLFVDDERDMRKLVSFILARQGYRVLTAADGEEGLATIKKEHPDVVLLDLMMPKMNGHDVLRHLKADPAIEQHPRSRPDRFGSEQRCRNVSRIGSDVPS